MFALFTWIRPHDGGTGLDLTERRLYTYLCSMRDSGRGATSGEAVLQAVRFFHSMFEFHMFDIAACLSPRVDWCGQRHVPSQAVAATSPGPICSRDTCSRGRSFGRTATSYSGDCRISVILLAVSVSFFRCNVCDGHDSVTAWEYCAHRSWNCRAQDSSNKRTKRRCFCR